MPLTKEMKMRNKPLYLKLFPLLAFGIALSFPLQIFYLYGIPVTNVSKVFSMLTPLNLLTMAALMVTAVLTVTLNKAIYKFIPALLLLIFANNAIVGLYGTDYTLLQVGLSFGLFGLSLKPFYSEDIKAVIMNPKLRWWESAKRYNVIKPLQLNTEMLKINSVTTNISKSGIFAEINEKEMLEKFDLNQVIDVKILGKNNITLKAKIIRKSEGENKQPSGFGLEFIKDANHKKNYIPWFKDATL